MKIDIKKLRTEAGITQAELSRRSGVPRQNISEIERGLAGVSIANLEKMLSALGYRLEAVKC